MFKVDSFNCAVCKIHITDTAFLKDQNEQALYYQKTSKETAVVFCGPIHSSDWSLENKDKIWNPKKDQ